MEVRGVVNGITVYDDFAHHPTAIATTVGGLRQKLGGSGTSGRILAVLEPRSNTMKLGAMKDALPGSLKDADLVFGFGSQQALGWSLADALKPAGRDRAQLRPDRFPGARPSSTRPSRATISS
jgi:UDP-N-acetylmuramate: L-alanyl-gamma-D-glutamyl-meso-diaminopimelate ligase